MAPRLRCINTESTIFQSDYPYLTISQLGTVAPDTIRTVEARSIVLASAEHQHMEFVRLSAYTQLALHRTILELVIHSVSASGPLLRYIRHLPHSYLCLISKYVNTVLLVYQCSARRTFVALDFPDLVALMIPGNYTILTLTASTPSALRDQMSPRPFRVFPISHLPDLPESDPSLERIRQEQAKVCASCFRL